MAKTPKPLFISFQFLKWALHAFQPLQEKGSPFGMKKILIDPRHAMREQRT